jgi:uncharacterized protein (TIGR02996 family)
MTEPDHTALAEALSAGKLAETSEALGVELDEKSVAALATLAEEGSGRGKPGMAGLLGVLFRAAHSTEGFAHEVRKDRRWHNHCLGIRWTDEKQRTRVSLGVAWLKAKSIGGVWPDLKAWARKPGDHADVAAAWGAKQLTFAVHAREETAGGAGDEAALLQAVIDAPEDDAPRLVYADWLLERGDIRGELIRLQCQHAKDEWAPEAMAIEPRIKEILHASSLAVEGDAAPYKPRVRRGFVDSVTMTIAAFAKHGERLFQAAPVRQLIVDNPRFKPSDLKKLADTPALRLVRDLQLQQAHTALDRGARLPLAAFAGSPHLGRLKVLRLHFCGASSEDWQELLENLQAPALEELELFYNYASPAIYDALARNRSLGRLRVIDEYKYRQLEKNGAAKKMNAALTALATGRPSLESLTFGQFEEVDDEAMGQFFSTASVVKLRHLELNGPQFSDALVKRMAGSPRSSRLEKLHLNRTAVTVEGIEMLLRSAHATSLTHLKIAGHERAQWTQERIDALATLLAGLPENHPLSEVELPRTFDPSPALRKQLKRFGISES